MVVYGIELDHTNQKIFVYQEDISALLAGKSEIDFKAFDCYGEKKADNWNPPAIEWFKDDGRNLDRYKDPDISYISMSGSLIVSPHTAKLLQPAVNDVAELLPIPVDGETWYFLNVFNQIDAMDKANSKYKIYRDGSVGYLQKAGFFPDKVPHAKLFTVAEDPAMIYYAEHHPDGNPNTFKNILEKNKLFGIVLEKIQEFNS